MNPSPYEVLTEMMNDQLVAKVLAKYGFTLKLGGRGPAREDAITFTDTDLGGGTRQESLNIPGLWMDKLEASTADEFIDALLAS